MSSKVDPSEHQADACGGINERFELTPAKPTGATGDASPAENHASAKSASFGAWGRRNDPAVEIEALCKEWAR